MMCPSLSSHDPDGASHQLFMNRTPAMLHVAVVVAPYWQRMPDGCYSMH